MTTISVKIAGGSSALQQIMSLGLWGTEPVLKTSSPRYLSLSTRLQNRGFPAQFKGTFCERRRSRGLGVRLIADVSTMYYVHMHCGDGGATAASGTCGHARWHGGCSDDIVRQARAHLMFLSSRESTCRRRLAWGRHLLENLRIAGLYRTHTLPTHLLAALPRRLGALFPRSSLKPAARPSSTGARPWAATTTSRCPSRTRTPAQAMRMPRPSR